MPENFAAIVDWVAAHSYFFIFIGMAIEGPTVTAAAAFASALGHIPLSAVYALSLAGDFIPDVFYFTIGYFARGAVLPRLTRWFKISEERIKKIEALILKNQFTAVALSKVVPFLGVSGVTLSGVMRIPLKNFIIADITVGLINSAVFLFIGYNFGHAYESISRYLKSAQYAFLIMMPIVIAFYVGYRKLISLLSKKIEQKIDTPS